MPHRLLNMFKRPAKVLGRSAKSEKADSLRSHYPVLMDLLEPEIEMEMYHNQIGSKKNKYLA
jgi:hypothetical protein